MEISEKTYKFAKPKLVEINGNKVDIEYSWMLVLESMEDLEDYTRYYQDPQIKEGLNEIITKDYAKHNTTSWGYIVETLSEIKQESFLISSAILENEVFRLKAKLIRDFGRIYVNTNGGCFPHSKSLVILDEKPQKGLIWPTDNLTIKDADIKKWPNGTHWYAKIGKMDVVVKGQQKWDTYAEARSACVSYISKHIKENS